MKTKFKVGSLTLGLAAVLPLMTSAQITTAPKLSGTTVNVPVPEIGSSGQRPPTPGFNGAIKLDVHDIYKRLDALHAEESARERADSRGALERSAAPLT